MRNQAMYRKLKARKAIDISDCARTKGGDYVLERFKEDVDYCDAAQEAWVWSIGRLLEPVDTEMTNGDRRTLPIGTYLARLDSAHYTAEESQVVKCVFLR
jgi:hypothetical protein